MKSPFEIIKTASTALYNHYKKDPAKMLIHTGTIGWTLSAMAQVGAVLINKDIPKDQKRFLIPQEILDAGINIATFFLFTNSCNEITKRLVKSGKISSAPIRKFIENKIPKEKIGKFDTNLETIIEKLPKSEQAMKDFKAFHSGVTVGVNVLASVIASNILTPILRNSIGARVQKKLIADDKAKKDQVVTNKVILAQNQVGQDKYRSAVNPYPTSGSMKI